MTKARLPPGLDAFANANSRSVLSQYPDDPALQLHRAGWNNDRFHRGVGRLKSDVRPLTIEALQRCVTTLNQRYHNLAIACGIGLFHKYVIAIDNVLVLHAFTLDLKHENILR